MAIFKYGSIILRRLKSTVLFYVRLRMYLQRQQERLSMRIGKTAALLYPQLHRTEGKQHQLSAYGLKVFSQSGEDGILMHIFSRIGVHAHTCVEIAAGDGKTCNTANFIINFSWNGLLVDGDKKNTERAQQHYETLFGKGQDRARIACEFVTRENVNSFLRGQGFCGIIDLLSIDIDGNDYWLWDAITAIDPRVVVIEYNGSLKNDQAITVPYDPDFRRYKKHPSGIYHGASLKALEKLGMQKGYRLIGCDERGINAFFVKMDLGRDVFHTLTSDEAYYEHKSRCTRRTTQEQFSLIATMPFEHV